MSNSVFICLYFCLQIAQIIIKSQGNKNMIAQLSTYKQVDSTPGTIGQALKCYRVHFQSLP